MQFVINLDDTYLESLVELTGFYFEDLDDIFDEDVEEMIKVVIDNA